MKTKMEEISTGGGCVGWFKKKGKFTFYATMMDDLTLPEKGDHVSFSMYDKDFEVQYISLDIKSFNPLLIEKYIEKCIKKFNTKAFQLKLKNNNSEIAYI